MLQLIQIINHMMLTLEYTEQEVSDIFWDIQLGEVTLEDLLKAIGVEEYKKPIMARANQVIVENKWRSALFFVKVRLQDEAS